MARPKEFDPDIALRSAMELFWEKGYEATSIQDLVQRMGINRFSLYDTYGDKHELYIKAFKNYLEFLKEKFGTPLLKPNAGLAELKEYYYGIITEYEKGKKNKGCFLTNSIIEQSPHDEEIKKLSREFFIMLETRFKEIISDVQETGEINHKRNPKEIALYLIGVLQAINVLQKAFNDSAAMKTMVDVALDNLKNQG